jgi:long-chain fatty acid transport protein
MRFSRQFLLAAVSATALVSASAAFAGSFAVREQSATGLGASFAGVAAGSGGVSSIYWNPATITMNPGWQSEWHASVIFPDAKIDPTPTTLGTVAAARGTPAGSGNIGENALVPASYSSYQINNNLWVGLYTGAPYGFMTKSDLNWAGQVYGRSSKVFSFNATPTVGYKVNDWLSVGVGLQIQYIDVNLKRALAVTPNAPNSILEGDNTGVGYTLGVTLTPFAGTEIGLGFRSMIHHELEGTATVAPGVVLPIKANVNLPETVTFGVSQRITDQFKIMGGIEWTNWSRLRVAPVVNQLSGTALTGLPFRYDDGWFFSVGAEYQWTPQFAVRAGFAYEMSPIDDQTRDVRIPDNDRYWASLGATYKWSDKLSFDVAYSHIFVNKGNINLVPGNPSYVGLPFVAETKPSIDIVSVALKYRWDDPRKPEAVLVRKY